MSNYYHNTFLAQAQALVGDNGKVQDYYDRVSASAAMNYRQWPLIRVGHPNNENHFWPVGTTYADAVKDLNTWLTARIANMSAVYDHTWDAGVVTKESTCSENGVRTYTCDNGNIMLESIPRSGHAGSDSGRRGDLHGDRSDRGQQVLGLRRDPCCADGGSD